MWHALRAELLTFRPWVLGGLVTGHLDSSTLRLANLVAGVFFASGQMGPLAQEATAARRQQRPRAAVTGWAVFGSAILCMVVLQWILHTVYGYLGLLIVGLAVMAASAVLYTGRTDFTR